ncbi:alanine racemase [Zhouia sp. PK063]|uniref:alanine racemase n=1 Tax=Zhouia sp. PK063 TaxID=3373602 RepID=UPI0037BB5469
MPPVTETVLEVNLHNLQHNFTFMKDFTKPNTKFLAVVKANAYGQGAVEIAKFLETLQVDYFAVAYVSEGIQLREAGITTPILVLHPQSHNYYKLIEYKLEPSLYSNFMVNSFIKIAKELQLKEYPVHIKFNTGLNRLGFSLEEIDALASSILSQHHVKVASIFSHLAASEDINEKEFTQNQIHAFKTISEAFSKQLGYTPIRHLCNTSGIINYPEAHFDMVRCGIGLYGYGNNKSVDAQLKPVSSFKTIISQFHHLKTGESVGYNRGFIADKETVTATLPFGHADGIGRQYGKGKGFVTIQGKKALILGNVCMDMVMVDVTNINCNIGDEVLVFGESVSAETFAATANTISYELITGIAARVKRLYLY